MPDFPGAIEYYVDPERTFIGENDHVAIVCHGTGGSPDQTAQQLGDFFRTVPSEVSVHYGIDRAGVICQYVPESAGAGGLSGRDSFSPSLITLQKSATLSPFMQKLVAFTEITGRTSYHKIRRVIRSLAAKRNDMINVISSFSLSELFRAIIASSLLSFVLPLYVICSMSSWCCFDYRSSLLSVGAELVRTLLIALSIIQQIFLPMTPIMSISLAQAVFSLSQVTLMVFLFACFGALSFSLYLALTNFTLRSKSTLSFFPSMKVFRCGRKVSLTSRAYFHAIDNSAFPMALRMLLAIRNKAIRGVSVTKKVFSSSRKKLFTFVATLISIGKRNLLRRAFFPELFLVFIYAHFAKTVKSVFLSLFSGKEVRCSRFVLLAFCTLLQRGILGYSVHTLDLLSSSSVTPPVVPATRGQKHVHLTSSLYHRFALQATLYPFYPSIGD